MIDRRWTASLAEILIDSIELLQHGRKVLENELRLLQRLRRKPSAQHCRDRQGDAVRRQYVIRGVSHGERPRGIAADAIERRLEDFRRWLRELCVFLRRRSFEEIAATE